jgi:hypothetical protein
MQKFTIVVLSFVAGLSAQESSPLTRLLDGVAPSVVTVRIVAELALPAMMGGEKHEMREETLGTIVDKSGLVLVASAALDPAEHMNMMFGDEAEVESTVTSLKVVIGNDNKELPATVVAKDDKLGFSYVKITDLGDRQLTAMAFDQKSELAIGTEVYAVRRLPEGYDFAPFAARNTIAGRIKKPRSAWVLAEGLDTSSPVFTADGALCGVVARVEAGSQDDDPRSMMMRMLGGGRGGALTFVVSPQVAANSVAQALEAASKAPAAAPAAAPSDAPSDAPK